MNEKEINERRGIVMNPNQLKKTVVHEIPFKHGPEASGIIL
jgi:hypothetical protein